MHKMRQVQERLKLEPTAEGLHDITRTVEEWVRRQPIRTGLLTIFLRHTSASLLIQEDADPDVFADLLDFFRRLAPAGDARYRHRTEGPDDMPAHIRAALTQTHLSIPVADGSLLLGTWQGIYLFEHRAYPHRREIVLHLIGTSADPGL